MRTGIIITKTKGFYQVMTPSGATVVCKIKGSRFKHSKYDRQLVAGDRVNWKPEGDNEGLIIEAHQRRTKFARKRSNVNISQVIAANAEYLCVVASISAPEFHPNLILRMMVAAYLGGMTPLLIVTKTDLAEQGQFELHALTQAFQKVDIPCFPFSLHDDNNKHRKNLRTALNGKISVFAGESGVGKTSLVNFLIPELTLKTLAVSEKFKTGKHTTTSSTVYFGPNNTLLIDTPGMREFHFIDMKKAELAGAFPGVRQHLGGCRFNNCVHLSEPQCSVKEATQAERIPELIYNEYSKVFFDLRERGALKR